mmetsp:Transcript_14928/g.35169  ORF Transcript_14928/g.35169 Transcript_14928/m.35169 type:complete len:126 (+) Transcript_14928:109-486(+)|eukprot:CAMPEP_0178413652 /NCGR_PEP_ID=MMETSP0689_2-20121128/22638_1 /TAXON_ID=160604 /ORGANISM="Amphidinium massartii, Strain CS-259" /LENGTH=125 /DNA_ID=CAMNT_0020034931 /DNA_START=13 /DNA_END=390 /DNA_ORIENTATION=-
MASRSRSAVPALFVLLACSAAMFSNIGFAGVSNMRGSVASRGLITRYGASDDTFSKVADVIADQLGVDKDKVTTTATLSELGADSLDIVETVMALEEEFEVDLPDEETTQLKNVGDVADLIQTKI